MPDSKNNPSRWNQAVQWGDHRTAGYLKRSELPVIALAAIGDAYVVYSGAVDDVDLGVHLLLAGGAEFICGDSGSVQASADNDVAFSISSSGIGLTSAANQFNTTLGWTDPPFYVNSAGLVTYLNADLLDGQHASEILASVDLSSVVPYTGATADVDLGAYALAAVGINTNDIKTDAVNNRVGIGTTTPSTLFAIKGRADKLISSLAGFPASPAFGAAWKAKVVTGTLKKILFNGLFSGSFIPNLNMACKIVDANGNVQLNQITYNSAANGHDLSVNWNGVTNATAGGYLVDTNPDNYTLDVYLDDVLFSIKDGYNANVISLDNAGAITTNGGLDVYGVRSRAVNNPFIQLISTNYYTWTIGEYAASLGSEDAGGLRFTCSRSPGPVPVIFGSEGNVWFQYKTSNVVQATTLAAGATTLALTKNFLKLTGNAAGNTLATITGGLAGQTLNIIFQDAYVTVTDDATRTANTINLSAALTGAANTVLTLLSDGTSWYEQSRSVNG